MEFSKCLLRNSFNYFLNVAAFVEVLKTGTLRLLTEPYIEKKKSLNNINTEKNLKKTDKFLMNLSKTLCNHNYHVKGSSLSEMLMKR